MAVTKRICLARFSILSDTEGEYGGYAEVMVSVYRSGVYEGSYVATRKTETCRSFFEAWVQLAEAVLAIVTPRRRR